MDILTQLLPPTYSGKAESIAKDSRRHRQNKKQKQQEDKQENVADEREIITIERRSGEDRRHKQMNRGRWLNSRTVSDRRKNPTKINVEI